MPDIKIGDDADRNLRIYGPFDGTVVFDVSRGDRCVCSNVNAEQAQQIVDALTKAFPSLVREVMVTFADSAPKTTFMNCPVEFMGLDLATGPDSTVVLTFVEDEPEPKVNPGGTGLHDPIFDCYDECFAARASQRLYGDPSHAVSKAQVAKQRERDAQGLDTPQWDGIDHSKFCSEKFGGGPVASCVFAEFGRFPKAPKKSL